MSGSETVTLVGRVIIATILAFLLTVVMVLFGRIDDMNQDKDFLLSENLEIVGYARWLVVEVNKAQETADRSLILVGRYHQKLQDKDRCSTYRKEYREESEIKL